MSDDDETTESETTDLPTTAAPTPELAWSQDDETDEQHRSWTRTAALAAGITTSSAAIAAGLWLGLPGFKTMVANHVAPPTSTSRPLPAMAAPTTPPTTVTVTAAPPAPTTSRTTTPTTEPTTTTSDTAAEHADKMYLQFLQDDGVVVTDRAQAIRTGHDVCAMLSTNSGSLLAASGGIARAYSLPTVVADHIVTSAHVAYCQDIAVH